MSEDDDDDNDEEEAGAGGLRVHPALLHDDGHPLLVLPLVLLVELRCLAVSRAVGVGLVQQGLRKAHATVRKQP